MTRIRPFAPGDEPALARICLRTADAGGDATGVLEDDDLWAELFVLPYVARHPEYALVVESDDGRAVGYLVGAPDTRAFEAWFRTDWWPARGARWPRPDIERTRQDGILIYAYGRRAGAEPYGDSYPAHLHIDLLAEYQRQGFGRRLMQRLLSALDERGVPGLHLTLAAANTAARAFYDRVGFHELPSSTPGGPVLGIQVRSTASAG